MLPLLPMHRVVQPSPHQAGPKSAFPTHSHPPGKLDQYPSHQQQHVGAPRSSTSFPHGLAASVHRAFPIRASQAPQTGFPRSSTFSVPEHEHRLRRKTPNGTIDAGYDGTPTQYASGPPPLKHMILPGSGNLGHFPHEYHPGPTNGWAPQTYVAARSSDAIGFGSSAAGLPAYGGGWQYRTDNNTSFPVALDSVPSIPGTPFYPYHDGFAVPTARQPSFQHSPGPALFNNGGLLPPSAWPDAGFRAHQASVLGGSYHGSSMHASFSNPQRMNPGLPLGPQGRFGVDHDATFGGSQTSNLRLDQLENGTGPYTPVVNPAMTGTPATGGFRDKALSSAHQAYVELLSFMHQSKKSSGSRSMSGPKPSSKMMIFPKLPKHLAQPASSFGSRYAPSMNDNPYGYVSHPATTGTPQPSRATNYHRRSSGSLTNTAYYHLFSDSSRYGAGEASQPFVAKSPLAEAKAALEVLHNLCEQSGWRWIDGMLLGGCLHYGLERYELALEWFSRIVALDESHAEALSNAGAASYCLNRNDEAEKHWRQAIRKRPSYLEAVEHLVGHLCASQRSKDAVDIISFVQDSLRVQKQASLGSHQGSRSTESRAAPFAEAEKEVILRKPPTESGTSWTMTQEDHENAQQPGYGSSGYRVPGSENGRIIALIHAKGNMLYALKDIAKASKAFEEAVLISVGSGLSCIQSLIGRIQSVLSSPAGTGPSHVASAGLLLLPPEKARYTAQMVFASHGELPGLRFVPDGLPKKSATSTTSNSLLSLAKIFQDGMSNGTSTAGPTRQAFGVGDILSLYYLSLSLSESPSTANNVGILLASVQHSNVSPIVPVLDNAANSPISGILPGSGLDLALAYYRYGLSLDAKHVHLHTNLGSLLKDVGQLDLAIQMYEQAVACDGTFDIALTNLANAVKDRGRIHEAIGYYRRAVESNPNFAEAVCGLATALNSVCDWTGRGGVILHGANFDRWHVDNNGMLKDAKLLREGSGLVKKVVEIVSRQLTEASHWGVGVLSNGALEPLAAQLRAAAADDIPDGFDLEAKLRRWAGKPWEGSRLLRLIERCIRIATQRWYRDKYVTKRGVRSSYFRVRIPSALAVPSAPTVLPFHTFTCPLTAKDIRNISQRNAVRISCSTLRSPWLSDSVYSPPHPPRPHLNIGYVSSDFNNHPLAHLMQSVFGFHDPNRAKAFCYATTASDRSSHRLQIEREAPVFLDASSWSAERLVRQIVDDQIHILVNLNGYTRGARNEIFAARPAPIQMSFMGFAGTLGAEWCDYILADETAIPKSTLRPTRKNGLLEDVFRDEEHTEDDGWVYSENIIFCRDTFFCCDHAQSCEPGERKVTWEEEQRRRWKMRKELFPHLSDDTIILGNFNQLYKIDPSTFRSWLRILSNLPNAVLWLLRFPELGESNLKRTARQWASEEVASRIIFTDVAPKQQHISRARVCDLFLDTPECNAHTTAADVLWSSTPLLTLPRYSYKMCSRMAASILKGALPRDERGLEAAKELIATDEDDYEALATRLAAGLSYKIGNGGYGEGHGRLADIRKILFDAKWTCALFDTRRWVRDLEDAYDQAWQRWVAGETGDIHL